MNADWSVTFTARARSDLLAVRRWLNQPGSGLRARLRLARINRALVELRLAPRRWPVGDGAGVRERPVEGHRIFYRVDEAARVVTILRVFGPFQDRSDV
jgi:plasmid stabilization system protein ParE